MPILGNMVYMHVIGIPITMSIRKRKLGNSMCLEEYRSYRVNKKVKIDFMRYFERSTRNGGYKIRVGHQRGSFFRMKENR